MKDTWNEMFEKLKRFRRRWKHIHVPRISDPMLADWIRAQQTRQSRLSVDRVEKLLKLGFDFGPRQNHWFNQYFALRDFIRKYGRFPSKSRPVGDENLSLGNWVLYQRTQRTKMEPQRVAMLNSLGMVWDSRRSSFDRNLAQLKAFKKKHGHCDVSFGFTENPSLARWVSCLRSRPERRSDAEIRLLDSLGFNWAIRQSTWETHYQELELFLKTEGEFPKKGCGHDFLADWMQRQRWQQETLSLEQRQKLDSLGFLWSDRGRADVWEQHYRELQRYRKQYGHCQVPHSHPEFGRLGQWLYVQRKRNHQLPPNRRERLDALGVQWAIEREQPKTAKVPSRDRSSYVEIAWARQYEALVAFHRHHGHCRVSHAQNRKLAHWTYNQRLQRGSLSAKQKSLLNALSYSWDPKAEKFENRVRQLQSFKKQYGHCVVPLKAVETEFPGLGAWVMNQRLLRQRNAAERVARLDALGFRWNRSEILESERWRRKL